MSQKINADADFCGRVPLHQTNLIQPHGVLLVVDITSHHILQASENAETVFGVSVKELVAVKLTDVLSGTDRENLTSLLAAGNTGKLPFSFQLRQKNYLSYIHQKQEFYILEIDISRRDKADESFASVYQNIKYIVAAMEATTTTGETCRVIAKELKKLSGFDKVMIYQFDEAWNGDVIAEEKEEGMESYLGLKFPASDIPKQARELYKKTPYRLIPSVDYQPVKLYPVLNPNTNAFTDLSDSNLRSVAGVHLEYLRNMNVTASMSTRILKDGELWGLIACHHRTANYLSFEMCAVFELMSDMITAKIGAMQNADLLAYKTARRQGLNEIMQLIYRNDGPGSYIQTLFTLLEADGMSIVLDNHIASAGKTPSGTEVEDLVLWLSSNEVKDVYHQPSLPSVYEPAENYAPVVSGLLALPIEHSKGNFILAFRSEAVQKVSWGGNPAEAIRFESDGKKYHPRASFQQWQQTVRNQAVPWKKEVLQTAEEVRIILTSYRLNNR
ncbi:MAG TPA: GAF domain-containing protein [Flavisolibacter sp.]|nr:GAF domain-containing protein [Flavisolibacter sp.]